MAGVCCAGGDKVGNDQVSSSPIEAIVEETDSPNFQSIVGEIYSLSSPWLSPYKYNEA